MNTDTLSARLTRATGLPWAWDPSRWAYVAPGGWELVELTDYSHELRNEALGFPSRLFLTDTEEHESVMLATVVQAVGGEW